MRHLRCLSVEVALLSSGVVGSAALSVLVVPPSAFHAGLPSLRRTRWTAVAVAAVTLAADPTKTPTPQAAELAVGVRDWPRWTQRVKHLL